MNFNNDWLKKQKFIIFGAGFLGSDYMKILKHYDSFVCFIDNSEDKQKTGYLDCLILSFENYLTNYSKYKIILACSLEHKNIIEEQMINAGLIERKDFLYIDDFRNFIMPYYTLNNFNESNINTAQICVTERCTLKCRKCAHGCYAAPQNSDDMPLNEIKKSADYFFSCVDMVTWFHLIGGEPFLHSDLSEAIIYIGENYRKQIKNFCITTNGTIIPKKDILNNIKKYNIKIMISNYSHTLPHLKSNYNNLLQTLNKNEIDYVFNETELIWTDYGFDYVDRGFFKEQVNEEERKKNLKIIFENCRTPCREVRGNKLYYCIQARTCGENMGFNVGRDDYLDLSKLSKNYESKKIITDFEMGIFPKGYLDMCNYCNGGERFNHPIPAAEQIIKNNKCVL